MFKKYDFGFYASTIFKFWYTIKDDPLLSEKAIKIFLPSPSTHLCKVKFDFLGIFQPKQLTATSVRQRQIKTPGVFH